MDAAGSGTSSGEMKLAPVRSVDDFFMDGARFQMPPFKDLEKWNNRVLSNLLYYQTNYFLVLLVVFLLVGLVHPAQMLYGFVAVALAVVVFSYATSQIPQAIDFKKAHPLISAVVILIAGYLLVCLMSSVVVFIFGITLPLFFVFLHASLRLRNLKNKLGNKLESLGFKSTPMGQILFQLCFCTPLSVFAT